MRGGVALLAILVCANLWGTAAAAPPPAVKVEIDYLLQYVEESRCEFYRNGSWYTASRARAHLQLKYDHLLARDRVASAEDFIDRAATRSSMSGQPYRVRCADGIVHDAGDWFSDALARYRAIERQVGHIVP